MHRIEQIMSPRSSALWQRRTRPTRRALHWLLACGLLLVLAPLTGTASAATGDLDLVSRAAGVAGAKANARSDSPAISADGRFVAFRSLAANLDPADNDNRMLLASMLLEDGKLEEGQQLLEGLPPGSVKDPAVYTNVGILFMNKNNPAQAQTYFTKAIELDAAQADAYYYRGLSYLGAKKTAEAKADFKKYLELKPQGEEAKEVREILQTLK